MTTDLRFAVVGCGKWAHMAHLPAFSQASGAKVVAVCDLDPKRAQDAADRFGVDGVYYDVPTMLSAVKLDGVSVVTPHHQHVEPARQVIEAGIALCCEKPLGVDLNEARALVALARQKGVPTTVGFTFRFSSAYQEFVRLIKEGFVGRIYHVQGFEQNGLYMDPAVPVRATAVRRKTNGGSLGGYGSHLVDLVRHACGESLAVSGHMTTFLKQRASIGGGLIDCEVDDGTAWVAELAGGIQGLFQTSKVAVGTPPGVEIRVYGDKGGLTLRLMEGPHGCEELLAATGSDQVYRPIPFHGPTPEPANRWPALWIGRLAQHMVDCLHSGEPLLPDFEDGLKAQLILDAVEESHRQRRWMEVSGQ